MTRPNANPAHPSRRRGRGALINPRGRFERLDVTLEPDAEQQADVPTRVLTDDSRSILSENDSPDLPFRFSLNPYRGCEHGCSYCYARPTHEYLGFSAGLDFETRILAKRRAPELLRERLSRPSWQPQTIAMSGVTDPYQPIERRLGITRECLDVLAELRNPVAVVTKNHLVTRDLDLLSELARHRGAAVFLSITTLDVELARSLEPRASSPTRRLQAIRELAEAGVPCGVFVAPIIPALNDHEVPTILKAAREAGASAASYTVVRLPWGVKGVFETWLREHRPERTERVLNRLRSLRSGALNDSRFGRRMRGTGLFAEQIAALFRSAARRQGFEGRTIELSAESFRAPGGRQIDLFP